VEKGWQNHIFFAKPNRIAVLARSFMSYITGVDKVQGDEAFEVYDDTRCHTFVILRTAVSDGKACSSL